MPTHSVGDQRWEQTGVNEGGDPVFSRVYAEEASASSDYSSMTKAELEDALEAKGLPKSGNKDELIARLQDG